LKEENKKAINEISEKANLDLEDKDQEIASK